MNEGVTASTVVGGVGKGLVGIVTKPIGGAADLIVHTGQGLLQVIYSNQVCHSTPQVKESEQRDHLRGKTTILATTTLVAVIINNPCINESSGTCLEGGQGSIDQVHDTLLTNCPNIDTILYQGKPS